MIEPKALEELVIRSSFIFSGTLVSRGQSALRSISARSELVIARLENALHVDPVLGSLDGRPITVLSAQGGELSVGNRFIFFANGWVHAEEIAVHEVAHTTADAETEKAVAAAIAAVPQRHLQERVASAVLIVNAIVKEVTRARDISEPVSFHAPRWMRAHLDVKEVLKSALPRPGKKGETVLYFPGSRDIAFANRPKVAAGQDSVFLLHTARAPLPQGSLIVPDPADIQPAQTIRNIRAMVSQ
jgi:hypothetical protein